MRLPPLSIARKLTVLQGILDGGQSRDDTLDRYEYRAPDKMIESGHTAGLVTLPSCIGTLKSTRIRTRLPLRSRSVMESLLERDMMGDREGLRRDGVQDWSYIRSMGTAGVASAPLTDTPRRERVATLCLHRSAWTCLRHKAVFVHSCSPLATFDMADSSDATANSLGLDLDALKIKDDPESSGSAEPPKEDKTSPEPKSTEASNPEDSEKAEEETAGDDEARSPTSEEKREPREKKKPYVNPERVKTGGAQRVRQTA